MIRLSPFLWISAFLLVLTSAVVAQNASGNFSGNGTQSDTTPPTLALSSAYAGSSNQITITAVATDSESAVTFVRISGPLPSAAILASNSCQSAGSCSIFAIQTGPTSGTKTYVVEALSAGGYTQTTIMISPNPLITPPDTTPPQINASINVDQFNTITIGASSTDAESAVQFIRIVGPLPSQQILAITSSCLINTPCTVSLSHPTTVAQQYFFEVQSQSDGGSSSFPLSIQTSGINQTNSTPNNQTVLTAICGNHLQENNEECDDGNTAADDGCNLCVFEPCGKVKRVKINPVLSLEGDKLFLSWDYSCAHLFSIRRCTKLYSENCNHDKDFHTIVQTEDTFFIDSVPSLEKTYCYVLVIEAPYEAKVSSVFCKEPHKEMREDLQNVSSPSSIIIRETQTINSSAIESQIDNAYNKRIKKLQEEIEKQKRADDANQEQRFEQMWKSLLVLLSICVVIMIIIHAASLHNRRKAEKEKIQPLQIIKEVLTDREKAIVEHLASRGNKSTSNYVRWELKIPRTTLHRLLSRLEQRGIIRLVPSGSLTEIELIKK